MPLPLSKSCILFDGNAFDLPPAKPGISQSECERL